MGKLKLGYLQLKEKTLWGENWSEWQQTCII